MCYFFTSTVKQCLCKTLIIIHVRKYFSNFVSVCRPVSLTLSLTICLCLCLCLCVYRPFTFPLCLFVCVCVCECVVCVCVCARALCTVCAESLNGPSSSLVDVRFILTVASHVEKG